MSCRDKLREELTFANIDRHAEAAEEIDVEGLLAFAERALPDDGEARTPFVYVVNWVV